MARDSRQRFVVKNDAEVVKIRFRENRNGAWSIYFDTYLSGKRVKESIGRELVAEKTPMDRAQNENTMMAVRVLRAEKVKEIASRGIIANNSVKLYDFAKDKVHDIASGRALMKMLEKNNMKMSAVNELAITKMFHAEFAETYRKKYIETIIAELNLIFKTAIKQGLILTNPINRQDILKHYAKQKEVCYLTIDELRMFEEAYMNEKKPHKKRAMHLFLFSCYTGLRISDIRSLKVSNIVTENGKPIAIDKIMDKPDTRVVIPLSNKAIALLPDISSMDKDSNVFFVSTATQSTIINIISKELNFGKHISFHVARHTFATTALTLGADLYTVSKLLGHASIATTQIYAKIVDSKKKSAIDLFDNL